MPDKKQDDLGGEKIRNQLLASLPVSDLSLLRRHLREIPIEQGQILKSAVNPSIASIFPRRE
jgi:hypothetical protein